MKILMITVFPPQKIPEADHALHLCERLAEAGFDIDVITQEGSVRPGHPRITVHAVMRQWSWPDLPRLIKSSARCAPDAVLLPYFGPMYNYQPMITFAPTIFKILRPGAAFVTLFEDYPGAVPWAHSLLSRAARKGMAQLAGHRDLDYEFGTLLRDSDRMIFVSDRVRSIVGKRCSRVSRKSVVIPVPPSMYLSPDDGVTRQRQRKGLGLSEDDIVIAYFGYIYPRKGVDTLLKAFQIVSAHHTHVRLMLVGGGGLGVPQSYQKIYEMPKQLGIEDKLIWSGEYAWDSDEGSRYLRAADLCVLPFTQGVCAHNGSFASVAVHGLPIITTHGPTTESIFIHNTNVFLCPPENAEALAAAMTALIADPALRKRLGEGARELAAEWFSWDKATERITQSLDAALRDKSERRSRRSLMVERAFQPIRAMRSYRTLPPAARAEQRRDRQGLYASDPGAERGIAEGIAWLCRAQDHSTTDDGGVARHYSLVTGWAASYPETTGYIVPTMLAYARLRGDEAVRHRARRMLDWLVSIQLPCGGFQGGLIDSQPIVPVTFNTGQILLGLAAGVREFGDEKYHQALRRAADWLVAAQDPDGCWRRYPSPFAKSGDKAYDTHAAWGLLEAARLEPGRPYAEAALANVRWALGSQRDNGWFDDCCLSDSSRPFTHTLGYVLRGILEAYRFGHDQSLLEAARKTADGLLTATSKDGFLPGRLDSDWRGTVSWACLTGTAQIAICWLMLFEETGDVRYWQAACAGNRYVRRTMRFEGPSETRGGVKGAFPVHGEYGQYEYLNWAVKFFIDANLLEQELQASRSAMVG
jgi:glycosyltransferase involved in cell wall biosynthesis